MNATIDQLPEKDQFYHAFGEALAEWANLEFELGEAFHQITNMTIGMGRDVFYSATAFRGRAAMLGAAIASSARKGEDISVIEQALARAVSYETFRNQIAHGQPQPDNPTGEGSGWRLTKGSDWLNERSPNLEALRNAAANFKELKMIVRGEYCEGPEQSLRRLEALPSAAGSNQLSQKQAGRLRQRQAAQGKEPNR